MRKHATVRGVGGMFQENLWNLEAMRLLLRPVLGQYDASWRPAFRLSSHLLMSHGDRLSSGVHHCLDYIIMT